MKLTTSTTISMLLAIIFDKTQPVKGGSGYCPREIVGAEWSDKQFVGTDDKCYNIEDCWAHGGYGTYDGPLTNPNCPTRIDLGDGTFLCPRMCCFLWGSQIRFPPVYSLSFELFLA